MSVNNKFSLGIKLRDIGFTIIGAMIASLALVSAYVVSEIR